MATQKLDFDNFLTYFQDPRRPQGSLLGSLGPLRGSPETSSGPKDAGVGDPVAGNIIFGTSECPEEPQGPYGPAQEGTILESFFGRNLALETAFHFSNDF